MAIVKKDFKNKISLHLIDNPNETLKSNTLNDIGVLIQNLWKSTVYGLFS